MDPAYDAQSWQNFFIVTGGAAAALTGLLFVAMSLHAKAITADKFHGGRAIGTLISLMTQLFLSVAVLVPEQSTRALGIEVELAAVFFLVLTFSGFRRTAQRRPTSRPSLRTIIELLGASTWIVLFVVSGVSLLAHAGGGFYILAVVMMLMFGWNVYVAWVLITEVSD